MDVYIDKAAKSGEYPLQFMKDGKSLAIINYSLEARVSGSQNRESFTSKDVIYLITPDRFANGDKTNDAFPAMLENDVDRSKLFSRHGGDIQGIIDRLDYIKRWVIRLFGACLCLRMIKSSKLPWLFHHQSL